MSESDREAIEPPGGYRPKSRPDDLSAPELKPDWLVGADDGLDFGSPRDLGGPRPALSRPGGGAADPPPVPRRAEPTAPEAAETEPAAEAWAPAGSSIPKFSVVPRREPAAREREDDEALAPLGELGGDEDAEGAEGQPAGEGAVAPEEPWWLVAIETLATNRWLQGALALVAVVLLAWTFWPRKENQTVAIAAIKRHPQRFEGQAVRIRGEVGEVFDVGSGYVFELHQRRDTLVVFSPGRRPALHDRVVVQGTVSTGYLDGTPRVALFEAPGAPAR